jgi:hypothetical protein
MTPASEFRKMAVLTSHFLRKRELTIAANVLVPQVLNNHAVQR